MESDFARFRSAVLTVAKDSLNRLDALSAFAVVLRSDSDSVSFIEAEEVSDEPHNDVEALQAWLRQQVETGAYRAAGVCAPCEITLEDGRAPSGPSSRTWSIARVRPRMFMSRSRSAILTSTKR